MKIPHYRRALTLSRCALAFSTLAVAASLAGPALAGDGVVDRSKDGRRGLMRADANGDGMVSREEAAAVQQKKQSEWFDKTDTNKDGFLTDEEIRAGREARREHMRGEMKARMEERFREADGNADGQLSLDEVQAGMPRLAERFTALDTDRNGLLSKDELKRGGPHRKPPRD